jgi:hypothetical protein
LDDDKDFEDDIDLEDFEDVIEAGPRKNFVRLFLFKFLFCNSWTIDYVIKIFIKGRPYLNSGWCQCECTALPLVQAILVMELMS